MRVLALIMLAAALAAGCGKKGDPRPPSAAAAPAEAPAAAPAAEREPAPEPAPQPAPSG